ncbi:MAG: hypothetical protein JSS72_13370 [Armatimonadetes bacterium]|nr:hypothetical protein [Armatimonadota bacterium]
MGTQKVSVPGYKIIEYDPKKGYPGGWNRFYRCPICNDMIPATPPTAMACGCGNFIVEEVSLVRVRNVPPILLRRTFWETLKSFIPKRDKDDVDDKKPKPKSATT